MAESRQLMQGCDDLASDGWINPRLTGGHSMYGSHQVSRSCMLEQEPAGARDKGAVDDVVLVKSCQHQDSGEVIRVVAVLGKQAGGRAAVDPRHPHVHDYH